MTPQNLTISSPINGNCLQACVASLLDLSLNNVPNFMADEDCDKNDRWWYDLCDYLETKNYRMEGATDYQSALDTSRGVDGYFVACVHSINFPGSTHAVIFKGLKLVHDPSPKDKFVGTGKDSIYYYVIERLK